MRVAPPLWTLQRGLEWRIAAVNLVGCIAFLFTAARRGEPAHV